MGHNGCVVQWDCYKVKRGGGGPRGDGDWAGGRGLKSGDNTPEQRANKSRYGDKGRSQASSQEDTEADYKEL